MGIQFFISATQAHEFLRANGYVYAWCDGRWHRADGRCAEDRRRTVGRGWMVAEVAS